MIPHYTQKRHADGQPYYVFYYRCTKTMHYRNDICKIRHINANELEKVVVDHLDYMSKNEQYLKLTVDKVNADFQSQVEPLEEEEQHYAKRIKDIDTELMNYVQAIGKATISIELLEEAVARLSWKGGNSRRDYPSSGKEYKTPC